MSILHRPLFWIMLLAAIPLSEMARLIIWNGIIHRIYQEPLWHLVLEVSVYLICYALIPVAYRKVR